MPQPADPVELTRALINLDTVNPPGNEDAAARFLGELLMKGGLQVNYHILAEGRMGLVACLKGESAARRSGLAEPSPGGPLERRPDLWSGRQ
jgi:succinyl-diaminopimelate desuccinylase